MCAATVKSSLKSGKSRVAFGVSRWSGGGTSQGTVGGALIHLIIFSSLKNNILNKFYLKSIELISCI